jgi:N-acetyl sugar amidotransferase
MSNGQVGWERCQRCIMDRSDPSIVIGQSSCSHCERAADLLGFLPESEAVERQRLDAVVNSMKEQRSASADYDCIVGLSGGVDSSYVAYLAKQEGLRVLGVHFDNGWNSEIAVSNIESICRSLDIDLMTYVINWSEFRDLQRSFLEASVVDVEMVTDHAIMAALFRISEEQRIPFILSGTNVATESIMPASWVWPKQDLRNLRAIHHRFGSIPLKSYPTLGILKWTCSRFTPIGPEYIELLNRVRYRRFDAIETLQREVGWRSYGGKHFESTFTRFYQAVLLPRKFGIDKRKAHLSNLIINGEIQRDDALRELAKPPLAAELVEADTKFVLKKLGFSAADFDRIMSAEVRTHDEYPSSARFLALTASLRNTAKRRSLRSGTRS